MSAQVLRAQERLARAELTLADAHRAAVRASEELMDALDALAAAQGATPVAVPSLAEMPGTDTAPVCEAGQLGKNNSCADQACWRMQIAHLRYSQACESRPLLVCDEHRRRLEDVYRDIAGNSKCCKCGADLDHLTDIVKLVSAL